MVDTSAAGDPQVPFARGALIVWTMKSEEIRSGDALRDAPLFFGSFFANTRGSGRLEPDRGELKSFIAAMFKHAQAGTYVSLRAFPDHDGNSNAFKITPVKLNGDLDRLVDAAFRDAERAANAGVKVVFCPPTCTFSNNKRAGKKDVADGLQLSAECDKRGGAARAKLEKILGPATVVVESGGEWVDPETGEVEPKLHLHWRLRKPARGDERDLLEEARKLVIKLVDSDPTHGPISHPIRWPGSWHRKGEPRLCRIVTLNDDREIDLAAALAALKGAVHTTTAEHFIALGEAHASQGPNWGELIAKVISSESFHEPLTRLAAKVVASGMDAVAAGNLLRGLMEVADGPRDDRWKTRYADIDRSVKTAREKYETKTSAAGVEPADMWKNREAPPLPKGLLPRVIEEYAFTQAKLMGTDPAGIAMGALTVCAAAIPDHVQIQVKTHGKRWKESVRIWTALGGLVSAKKSPIMRTVTAPINRIGAEMAREYAVAMAAYEELSSEEKKNKDKPKRKRIRIEDVTMEAVQDVMLANPDGVMLVRDELSGWFGSMDKYSGGKGDRSFWLQTFNGDPYDFDRVGRGVGHIENLSMTLLGGIQEDHLRKVVAEGIDDGLIQRLFVIMLRPAVLGVDEPLEDDSYDNLVERLHSKSRNFFGNDVQFTDEAQVIRRQLEQKHLDLQKAYEKINKKLAGHIGKYDGLFARLCLLWHCIETIDDNWPSNIDAKTAQHVADFLHGFLLKHAVAFYIGVMGLSDDNDRLVAVAGYILAHNLERITNRDIQRGDRSMRSLTRRDTDRIFEQLEAYGWITQVQGKRFGDIQWVVNPEVHRKFAGKAKEEAERRREERALIIASLPGHVDEE